MADAVFAGALAVYLLLATVLLYRSPTSGWGFPMFVMVFPIFLTGFLVADAQFIIVLWLGLAFVNVPFQRYCMRRQAVPSRAGGVLVGSLFLWPIQFAAAINDAETGRMANKSRKAGREKIGSLPADVSGTVSYAHYLYIDEGYDAIWLEEFDDLEFMTDAKTRDRLSIDEGRAYRFRVEERDAPPEVMDGKVLWIVDAETLDP